MYCRLYAIIVSLFISLISDQYWRGESSVRRSRLSRGRISRRGRGRGTGRPRGRPTTQPVDGKHTYRQQVFTNGLVYRQPIVPLRVASRVKDERDARDEIVSDVDDKKRSPWLPSITDKAVQTESFDMKSVRFLFSSFFFFSFLISQCCCQVCIAIPLIKKWLNLQVVTLFN